MNARDLVACILGGMAGVLFLALACLPDRKVQRPEYINVQTCVYASSKEGEFGDKPGHICDRLDPHTHWALRQYI